MKKFNINDRVISLTTDNRSNMVACDRDLTIELDREFSNLLFKHYHYVAHIINLAVKAGLKYVDSAIIKLWQFVIKVRNSPKLLDDLRTIYSVKQKQLIMSVQDVEIRWNATYYIIECVTSFFTLQRYKVTVLLLLDRELYCLKLTRNYVTTLTNYKDWVTTKVS